MPLTRWEPFSFDWPDRWRRLLDFDVERTGWLRVEELREDDTCIIRAELPDIDPEKDVEVSVTDHMLHISARREEHAEHKGKTRRSEFRYGEFSRDLALPAGVDRDAVKASYKDGILEVRIPWPEAPKEATTRVEVSRS